MHYSNEWFNEDYYGEACTGIAGGNGWVPLHGEPNLYNKYIDWLFFDWDEASGDVRGRGGWRVKPVGLLLEKIDQVNADDRRGGASGYTRKRWPGSSSLSGDLSNGSIAIYHQVAKAGLWGEKIHRFAWFEGWEGESKRLLDYRLSKLKKHRWKDSEESNWYIVPQTSEDKQEDLYFLRNQILNISSCISGIRFDSFMPQWMPVHYDLAAYSWAWHRRSLAVMRWLKETEQIEQRELYTLDDGHKVWRYHWVTR